MSKYTTTIKNLIDNHFDFKMTSYPIFDEDYRNTLNQNILNHYYESEIGFETASLFRFYLNQTLNEIMPYYNELYKIQKEVLKNSINNVNLTETLQRDTSTTTNSNSTSNNNGENIENYTKEIMDTWTNINTKFHFSSPQTNLKKEFRSHHDYINSDDFIKFINMLKIYNKDVDIMLEAKAKDDALSRLVRELKYKTNYEFINETSFII